MSNKTIYDALRAVGMTAEGACGLMGNFQAESGCEACRLQGDFSQDRTASRNYAAAVTNGSISRQQFGSDQKGFGLAQWTWVNQAGTAGRKFDLYDFWKASGDALDSETMQTAFCVRELKRDYPGVWKVLTESHDLYECTRIVCVQYERPAVNNVDARYRFARDFFEQLAGGSADPEPVPEPAPGPGTGPQPDPEGELVVMVLQLLMRRDGYWDGPIDGIRTPEWREDFREWSADVAIS